MQSNGFFERLLVIIGVVATVFSCYVGFLVLGRTEARESLLPFALLQTPNVREVPVTVVVERIITVAPSPPSEFRPGPTLLASIASSTPLRTFTATPTPTFSDTPSATPTLIPPTDTETSTPTPTQKPTFTPSPVPLTKAGSILNDGETWYAQGWSLTVNNFTYKSLSEIQFTLQNNTDRLVLFPNVWDGIKIVSDAGDNFGCVWDFPVGQREIQPNEKVKWKAGFRRLTSVAYGCHANRNYSYEPSPNARTLTLMVGNFSDVITDAKWQAEIPRP